MLTAEHAILVSLYLSITLWIGHGLIAYLPVLVSRSRSSIDMSYSNNNYQNTSTSAVEMIRRFAVKCDSQSTCNYSTDDKPSPPYTNFPANIVTLTINGQSHYNRHDTPVKTGILITKHARIPGRET